MSDITRSYFLGVTLAMAIICLMLISGSIFYSETDFTATVIDIEYYGRSNGWSGGVDMCTITFSDGSIQNYYKNDVPIDLKIGSTYDLSIQDPYILGSKRLVIKDR